MPKITLIARASRITSLEMNLYLQVSYQDSFRLIPIGKTIRKQEWNKFRHIIIMPRKSDSRYAFLANVRQEISFLVSRLELFIQHLKEGKGKLSAERIAREFEKITGDQEVVVTYLRSHARKLDQYGRVRSSETLMAALRSFMMFLHGDNPRFRDLTDEMMQRYEAWLLRKQGVVRNTSSFYMRILRTYYKKAVEDGLCPDIHPFRRVYTGVDKTVKRAISMDSIKKIKSLDLSSRQDLDYARDIFLMSFLLRGMSFVDMAFLRKKDLLGGVLTYRRRKTGQLLEIGWERSMQAIVDKYDTRNTQYLLPIIQHEDGSERKQYLNAMIKINRSLKVIASLSGIEANLSTYTARHSWASAARDLRVDLPVISRALGHNNQLTTSIYLSDIKSQEVDKANQLILEGLFSRRPLVFPALT